MNKNSIIILTIVGLLILGGIGYAVWYNYNSPAFVQQENTNQPNTTQNNNSNTVLEVGAPIVQTNQTAAPYISTVAVSGTVNPNGALTTYWYEYGQTSALGTKTSTYLVGSGYTKFYTPAYITGLLANTTYYFKLSASNSIGTVSGTTYSFETSNTPPPVGVTPTVSTDSASDITRTTANLKGQINPKGSQTTYWFEYGTTSSLGFVTSLQTVGAGDSSTAVALSVSNLSPATKYYFRMNAQNQFGTVNGTILNFTTKGPAEVLKPVIDTGASIAITSSSAKLNGAVNPSGAETTYWFEYSKDSAITTGVISSQETKLIGGIVTIGVSADVINLSSDTKYYYKIVARNQNGTVNGSIKSFTTKK